MLSFLRGVKHHPWAAVFIVMEIAVACVVMLNAIHLGAQHAYRLRAPIGIDGSQVAWLRSQSTETGGTSRAESDRDLDVLRHATWVRAASQVSSLPLMESAAYSFGIAPLEEGEAARWMKSGLYLWSPHARNALGVSLLHGNGFAPDDYVDYSFFSAATPPTVAMVTAALARELFGDESAAVGKRLRLRLPGEPVVTLTGVVADMAGPALHFRSDDLFHVILPVRYARSGPYVVRGVAGRSRMVHDSARAALATADPSRAITHGKSFAATERRYFQGDREMMWLFGILVVALGALVVAGIVAVTYYWVVQRGRTMDVLRAPGGTRRAMVARFAVENAVLLACGAGLGLAGAAAANLALAHHFEGRAIPLVWYPLAFVGFLIVGQVAIAVAAWRYRRETHGQAAQELTAQGPAAQA